MRTKTAVVAGVVSILLLAGARILAQTLAGYCCQNGNFECQGCVEVMAGNYYQMGYPLTPKCQTALDPYDTCIRDRFECFHGYNVDFFSDNQCTVYAGTTDEVIKYYAGCDNPGSGTGCD